MPFYSAAASRTVTVAVSFSTAAKKSRVVSDAEDSDSDVVSDKPGTRGKTAASDSEEAAGEDLPDKKSEEKDLFGSDSESGNDEE